MVCAPVGVWAMVARRCSTRRYWSQRHGRTARENQLGTWRGQRGPCLEAGVRETLLDPVAAVLPQAVFVIESAKPGRHLKVDTEAIVKRRLSLGRRHDGAATPERVHQLEQIGR
jgi:hypothetical protein